MGQELNAIFENGVLRPLTPLNLGEATEVRIVLQERNAAAGEMAEPNPIELQQQRLALNAMFEEVDKLPQTPRNDGLSGRDHDKILYGSSK